jgi:hypothetical protein
MFLPEWETKFHARIKRLQTRVSVYFKLCILESKQEDKIFVTE